MIVRKTESSMLAQRIIQLKVAQRCSSVATEGNIAVFNGVWDSIFPIYVAHRISPKIFTDQCSGHRLKQIYQTSFKITIKEKYLF